MAGEAQSAAYRTFLSKLVAAREAAGLQQQAVACALGKHPSWLSKSEAGERRLDVIELLVLARLYGRRLEDLMLDDELLSALTAAGGDPIGPVPRTTDPP